MTEKGEILVAGARTHNLKGVTVRIPRGALTVVTGVSGSGKSSLAFDTLYAEGQRRYVESMSTYARQFLERMARPDVDLVEGIPPAIAIEQRNGVRNARSTVGTATEISDFLRLLYATVGEVRCPSCGGEVARHEASRGAADAAMQHAGKRAHVVAEVAATRDGARLAELARAGHGRLFLDGKAVRLEDIAPEALLALDVLPVLIDRLILSDAERPRLAGALDGAFALTRGARASGAGKALVFVEGVIEPVRFDEGFRCARCGKELQPPTPALFSYNSPLGACGECQGFGRVVGVDLDKVIPDAAKSLADGAIAPFQTPSNQECQDDLVKACRRRKIRLDVPWREMGEGEKAFVLDGEEGGWKAGKWYGVRGFFRWLESKKYKMHYRILLARYRGYTPCAACRGTRLRAEARAVLVGGRTIAELEALPVGELRAFLGSLPLGRQAAATAEPILRELASRLAYLDEVGLDYLTLIRQTRSLSGGEAQRIALASALGMMLTGTLYVLDEPSVGLHARDADRLMRVLRRLTERGNTVVVVEHDPELIRQADHVIDLGPAAGAAGGEVVFAGNFDELLRARGSRTADIYRRRARELALPSRPHPGAGEVLRIVGARAHNLKDLTVDVPLGCLVAVTGVSGSGKSSLVEDVLYCNFQRARGRAVDEPGECARLEGTDLVADVELVDQSPLARSSRSNPATSLKAFEEIRKLLARTDEARRLGLEAGAFSFNVARDAGGGRCEACAGQGTVTLEMHFLADVTVPCDACGGRRFDDKVLAVRWNGKSVGDILDLTVAEAIEFFDGHERIVTRLRPFVDVGLGYLRLGQSTATLSGGESQRLKLAAHLVEGARDRDGRGMLFILDEPTTGLHAADVEVLLAALGRLRDAGHSIVVVEHNLDFIRHADWVLDLGPEAGAAGGELVAVGTPAAVARARHSHTGRALAAVGLAGQKRG